MIAEIENIVSILEQIKKDMPDLIGEVIEESEDEIREMNIEQLDAGQRADGSSLPNYSPVSVRKFGKRPGPMTLENTGAFRKGIKVKSNKTFAEIIGTDPKTGMLEALYGLDIVALSDENLERLTFEIVLPRLIAKIETRYLS